MKPMKQCGIICSDAGCAATGILCGAQIICKCSGKYCCFIYTGAGVRAIETETNIETDSAGIITG